MNRVGLGLAVGAGYVLGRTKKMKLAFAVGSLVAGKRMNLSPKGVADLVSGQLKNNPQFKEIGDQLREDLRGVGKAASGAMVERQIDAVADRLHGRTAQVRDQLSGVVPDLGARDEDEAEDSAEDEEPQEEYEEEEEEEGDEEEEAKDTDEDNEAEEAEEAEEADEADEADEDSEPRRRKAAGKAPEKAGKAPEKKAPAKKSPTKKTAAKKAPARKAPAKKTAGRKTAAKQTAGKKTAAGRSAGGGARNRLPKGGDER